MKRLIPILCAATIVAGATSPALAHGGGKGGGGGSPALVKARAAADAKACKENPNKCIGFGKHYYGQ